jgi:putative glycosyltransferase
MDLSIVTTLYRSAPHVREFYDRASAAAQQLTDSYEIIFVNDGSPDNALELAIAIFQDDPRVRVVDLSRNFGHHRALMTGLRHARGALVLLIDSDLEEEPELLHELHSVLKASGADVAYGVQERRKGALIERVTGALFYRVFNALSKYPMPVNLVTLRLMTRRYVQALLQHTERELTIGGLWVITGFEQVPVLIRKHSKGTTSYELGRKLTIVIDSVTSFSDRPLIFIFYLGTLISVLAGIAAGYLVIQRLFFGVLLMGWPSLIVSVWLLGGMTMLCLGILGIYLSKVFLESKQRPLTIVRQLYEHDTANSSAWQELTAGGRGHFDGQHIEPAIEARNPLGSP